ncbi:MAG TPA: hypothetical protein PLO51_01615 [Candidatus Micrarchaeota archaeon]|nr:hypothetical protein [Candidatus Micrarchaeota archaeon]
MAVQNFGGGNGNALGYQKAFDAHVVSIFVRHAERLKSANENVGLAHTYDNLVARAIAYQKLGRARLAAQDYLEAFKTEGKLRLQDMKNASLCLEMSGQHDKAMELAKETCLLYSHDFSALLFAGKLLYNNEKYQESVSYFRKALDTMRFHALIVSKLPFYTRALSSLAMSLYCCADYKGASQSFTEFLNLRPDNISALVHRAECDLMVGNHVRAVGDLMYASALEPDNYLVLTRLGIALSSVGQLEEGRCYLEMALGEKGGHYAAALYNLGIYHYHMGDYSASMGYMTKAASEDKIFAHVAGKYIEKIKAIFRNEAGESGE